MVFIFLAKISHDILTKSLKWGTIFLAFCIFPTSNGGFIVNESKKDAPEHGKSGQRQALFKNPFFQQAFSKLMLIRSTRIKGGRISLWANE